MTYALTSEKLVPPVVNDRNAAGSFLRTLQSPWFVLVADLQDTVMTTTIAYAKDRGLKNLPFPLTTRTVTCPSALGSDSKPVPVKVLGVDTYLPDSMQFSLEYGCRLAPAGCFTVMPSYRGEQPDHTHLNQFLHSEAEVPGGLSEITAYVDGYVRALSTEILDRYGDRLIAARGDISHLERMVNSETGFEQLTFKEALRVIDGAPGCVRDEGNWRSLTRRGERLLMERVSEFVWVQGFDSLAVPFYQAFNDDDGRTARAADLYFGLGEIVGSGERHSTADGLRQSIKMHGVHEAEYAWYVRMREDLPMRTSGFGMGVERFLMWVLAHNDIRDIPLISRLNEPGDYPAEVHRP